MKSKKLEDYIDYRVDESTINVNAKIKGSLVEKVKEKLNKEGISMTKLIEGCFKMYLDQK